MHNSIQLHSNIFEKAVIFIIFHSNLFKNYNYNQNYHILFALILINEHINFKFLQQEF